MDDGDSIMEYIRKELSHTIDYQKVFLYGRSLGGAVAIYIASQQKYQFRGLIIENTFTCIEDLANKIFPIFKPFIKYLLKNFWPSLERMPKITQPILIFSAEKDQIVPPEHSELLKNAAKNSSYCTLYCIKNATHNDAWNADTKQYFSQFQSFLSYCLENDKIEEVNNTNESSSLLLNDNKK